MESYVARVSPMSIVHVGGLTERPTSANINFSHFHGACWEEVRRCPHASMWGSKWGIVCKWSQAIVF